MLAGDAHAARRCEHLTAGGAGKCFVREGSLGGRSRTGNLPPRRFGRVASVHHKMTQSPQSGRATARSGLRMMPTFPSPSLRFRMAGFPQYGFKAGMSDRAFPFGACPSRRSVGLRPSCSPLAASESPYCAGGRRALEHLRGERPRPLYPRGPRSGLGSVVPVHPHLFGPIRPTRRRISISPLGGLYEMPSLCVTAQATREWFRAFAVRSFSACRPL